jgi:hypothetical protein
MLAVAGGCAKFTADEPAQRLRGQMAPEIALAGIDGETLRLSSLRDRPVIVTFFATW